MSALVSLPEDRQLRALAKVLEEGAISGEVMDRRWRIVHVSSETARIIGVEPADLDRFYGITPVVRNLRFPDEWGPDPEGQRLWWATIAPLMRADISPGDPDFEAAFGPLADAARKIEPDEGASQVAMLALNFPGVRGLDQTWLGAVRFLYIRLRGAGGDMSGGAHAQSRRRAREPDDPDGTG